MIKRRNFLALTGASVVALFVGFRTKLARKLMAEASDGPWKNLKVLETLEWQNLAQVADAIIPESETNPSATSVGVLKFIENVLNDKVPSWNFFKKVKSSPNKGIYARFIPYYKKLLIRLDSAAQTKFGLDFYNLTPEDREGLLKEFSSSSQGQAGAKILGVKSVDQASDSDLFSLVRSHIFEGYFAEPKYGGNKNYAAWEAVKHICHFNYPKEQKSCPKHIM
jgi:gluconate 2-dehydrogenase gamma chain